jgi:uncharacterized repeat protein (TIGR04076 family)
MEELTMSEEKMYKAYQKFFGYTDEQMDALKNAPEKEHHRRVLKGFWQNPQAKLVAEVVKSEGCAAGHQPGDRYVIRADGIVNVEESLDNLCLGALAALYPFLHVAYERIAEQMEDLSPKGLTHTACHDCGFEDGGFGRVVMRVTVEK